MTVKSNYNGSNKTLTIYGKTHRILKELEHFYFRSGKTQSLKEIAHQAIVDLAKKEKIPASK